MPMKTYLLKALAANLRISPAPQTLADSTAVLRKLSSFGHISSFNKFTVTANEGSHDLTAVPPAQSANEKYKVLFSSPEGLSNALIASPFAVDVDYNLPAPKTIDPYNVRALQFRKQPTPRSFTCEVTEDEAPFCHLDLTTQSPFHGPFRTARDSELYKSLLAARAPLGIVRGISSTAADASPVTYMAMNEADNAQSSAGTSDTGTTAKDKIDAGAEAPPSGRSRPTPPKVGPSPKLMQMYREASQKPRPQRSRNPKRLIPLAPEIARGLDASARPREGRVRRG